MASAPKPRIPLRSITLQRLDGPRETVTVSSSAEADGVLRAWAKTAPEVGKGYHRVAYLLRFEDKRDYSDLYRLKQEDGVPASLINTVRESLEVVAGQHRRQPRLTSERQPRGRKKAAADLLDRYALE